MAVHYFSSDIDSCLEGLLRLLPIEIRPVVLGNADHTKDCLCIIDVRPLGSNSRSGFKLAPTPAMLAKRASTHCHHIGQSRLCHHDGMYVHNVEAIARSEEISHFFKVLGPALLLATMRSLSRGAASVVLGIGCNHARHRSVVAACLASHYLRQRGSHVTTNFNYASRVCKCDACRIGLEQTGIPSALALCQQSFDRNFSFRGVASSPVVRLHGLDNSGYSDADAGDATFDDAAVRTPGVRANGASMPRVIPPPARKDKPFSRDRSRSPVPRGGLPVGSLPVPTPKLPPPIAPPAASSSLTVLLQSYVLVICLLYPRFVSNVCLLRTPAGTLLGV